jgi:predicted solute-binding protein
LKLAYIDEFVTVPLARAIERRGWQIIPTDSPCELLNRGEADVVLASTVDYARCLGVFDYALVPGLGIVTEGFAGLIKLFFNRGLIEFATVAAKEPASSATVAASLVLAEKHDIEPSIVPVSHAASVEEMLASADAAVVAGDDAIFDRSGKSSLLDITDEWQDMVEMPLPYMLAWGRVGAVPQEAIDDLLAARDQAVLTLADYCSSHPLAAQANAFYQRYLRGMVRYSLDESDVPALETFFRYAFYHLAISDIPAVKYLPDGAPASSPAQPDSGLTPGGAPPPANP